MGSISRQFIRQKEKKLYKDFCSKWEKEINRQKKTLSSGGSLADNENMLIRRPTFLQWKSIVKSEMAKRTATPEDVQDFKNTVDLDWDEQ